MRNEDHFKDFVAEMKRVIESHELRKDSVQFIPEQRLVEGLMQEVHEFEIKNNPDHELIDIANSAYLLWEKRRFYKGG